jgi:hypothetical protein
MAKQDSAVVLIARITESSGVAYSWWRALIRIVQYSLALVTP